jgi:glycogenin glucosyltransferase
MVALEDVYCTLLLNDSYLPGASVLAHSLRDAGTTKKLAVLVTLDTLSADTITQLKALYDYVLPVQPVRNPNPANLYLMGRPDLAFAFTKIALWRQIQFRKIVYLDADVVVLRALDELFDIDASFAAAPDVGWPDAFNSGVMVLTPNMGEYWALQTMAASGDSFDGADQGLLNQYYEHRPWHRLSFAYNCTPNAQYQWEPAYRYYKRDIAAVHFIGKDKPWSHARRPGSGVHNELLGRWWAVHDRHLEAAEAPAPARGGGAQQVASQSEGQQYGQGEIASTTSAPHHLTSIPEGVEPEAPVTTTELPLSELGELVENIDQGVVEPTPTVEQRKFSAPQMEWDATISEPPLQSRPEAANFPSQTYTFNESRALFNPPPAYPEPPKDMWYEVPETKPQPEQKPKPIFPWEMKRDQPKATRVFAEDFQLERRRSILSPVTSPPMTARPPAASSAGTTSSRAALAADSPASPKPIAHPFSTVHYDTRGGSLSELEVEAGDSSPPRTDSPAKSSDEQWQEFQDSTVNAWDEVPGIGNYVRAIIDAQTRRSKPQVLYSESADLASPSENRRESLILTEFPSAIERPSLPVTPAPIRRPVFWGEERDAGGALPSAEGVPDQSEWVCPQCGFFSVSAADFHQRRRSLSSASTAVPSLLLTTTFATVVDIAPQTAEAERPVIKRPPAKHSIEGVSARGAPLASLTNPSLLTPPAPSPAQTPGPHVASPSVLPVAASAIQTEVSTEHEG